MIILEKIFEKDSYTVTLKVSDESHAMRLDQFLQLFLSSLSREHIKKKIKNGDIIIKGRPGIHRPSTKMLKNEEIVLTIPRMEHEDEYWRGEKLEVSDTPHIIYEDSDLIVIAKPPYMATHPTGRHLFNCATVFFEAKYKKTIHSIHRLDRETSGILLLGKNPKASTALSSQFEIDQVKKCYFFIAKISPAFQNNMSFWANERLGGQEEGRKRVIINAFPPDSNEGKESQTFFKILETNQDYALGLAFPQTGRQHQIRVHALMHGLPLIGDKLYYGGYEMFQRFKDNLASEEDYDFIQLPRHALHAVALKIPYKGTPQLFQSPLPEDLKAWIKDHFPEVLNNIEEKMQKEITSYFCANQ